MHASTCLVVTSALRACGVGADREQGARFLAFGHRFPFDHLIFSPWPTGEVGNLTLWPKKTLISLSSRGIWNSLCGCIPIPYSLFPLSLFPILLSLIPSGSFFRAPPVLAPSSLMLSRLTSSNATSSRISALPRLRIVLRSLLCPSIPRASPPQTCATAIITTFVVISHPHLPRMPAPLPCSTCFPLFLTLSQGSGTGCCITPAGPFWGSLPLDSPTHVHAEELEARTPPGRPSTPHPGALWLFFLGHQTTAGGCFRELGEHCIMTHRRAQATQKHAGQGHFFTLLIFLFLSLLAASGCGGTTPPLAMPCH